MTMNRRPCRDDGTKIADWELRIGLYRVYYNVILQGGRTSPCRGDRTDW